MLQKLFVTIALVAGFAAAGCQPDSPSEDAAESVEEAGDEMAETVEEAGEDLSAAAEDVGNEVEDACEDAKQEAGAEDTDC